MTQAEMQQAFSKLQQLNKTWSCVIRPDGRELKFFLAGRNQVLQLLAVGHPCIPMLLTAHAWALRASMPSSIHNTDSVCSLLTKVQVAIRAIRGACPCESVDDPLLRIWETVLTAFLRTQPLHAASAVLHAHRQRLAACTGEPVSEPAALRTAADAWTGALELAELVGSLGFKMDSAASSKPLADLASSHILQHLCALRLDLAESLARVGEGRGEGEEAGGGDAATAAAAVQLSKRLEQGDSSLLELVASIAHNCSTGGLVAIQRDLTVCVEVDTRRPGGLDAELRSALSHPAVQCLLGWWLVAPGAAAGGGGGRAWGLPAPLLRHVGDMGERDKLCVQALKGAALCWEQVLGGWEGPQPDPAAPPLELLPPEAAGTAAAGPGAATAGGAGLGRGVPRAQLTGAAGGGQVPQTTVAGPGAAATALASVNSRPVYSPAHMHRMCMAALRQCCSFPECAARVQIDAYFERVYFRPAVKKGLGVLVGSLLRMPPAKAARRLASVWRLLLRVSRAGFGISCTTVGLRMGQLLGELPPRLQQQGQQQHGRSRTAHAGVRRGELPEAVQGDPEVAAGGSASGSGEGTAGPGKHRAFLLVTTCFVCADALWRTR